MVLLQEKFLQKHLPCKGNQAKQKHMTRSPPCTRSEGVYDHPLVGRLYVTAGPQFLVPGLVFSAVVGTWSAAGGISSYSIFIPQQSESGGAPLHMVVIKQFETHPAG